MFNPLQNIIDNSFRDLNSDASKNIKFIFTRNDFLKEHRIMYCLRPRQVGATNDIAHIFDVETDVYVGYNTSALDNFKELLTKYGKTDKFNRTTLKAFTYSQFEDKHIKRVFIDAGGAFIGNSPTIMNRVRDKIAEFDKHLSDNVVYIVT